MRLHTKLTREDIGAALLRAQQHDKIMPDVGFRVLAEYPSRTHDRAFEFQLGAPDNYKRPLGEEITDQRGNQQKTRRVSQGGGGTTLRFAATYGEHGWFMAEVFKADPGAQFGSGKSGYHGVDDFHKKTLHLFDEKGHP